MLFCAPRRRPNSNCVAIRVSDLRHEDAGG